MFARKLYFLLLFLIAGIVGQLFMFISIAAAREAFTMGVVIGLVLLSPYFIYTFLKESTIRYKVAYEVDYRDAEIYVEYRSRIHICVLLSAALACISFAGFVAVGGQPHTYRLPLALAIIVLHIAVLLTVFLSVQMGKPVTNYFPPIRKIEYPEPLKKSTPVEYTTGLTYRDAEYWRFNHNRKKKKRKNEE